MSYQERQGHPAKLSAALGQDRGCQGPADIKSDALSCSHDPPFPLPRLIVYCCVLCVVVGDSAQDADTPRHTRGAPAEVTICSGRYSTGQSPGRECRYGDSASPVLSASCVWCLAAGPLMRKHRLSKRGRVWRWRRLSNWPKRRLFAEC